MAQTLRCYLFGDQTYDEDESLTRLLSSNDAVLCAFFERVYHALRHEISRLPSHQYEAFPRFSSIGDLLARKRGGWINPAVEQALSTAHSLGLFISQHSENGQPYPRHGDTYLLGFCTGALAAAAVSSATNVINLVPAAVYTTILAFHIGLLASNIARSINETPSRPQWCIAVSGFSLDRIRDILEKFIHQSGLPSISHPYISAYTSSGITLSAPPDVLTSLLDSGAFQGGVTRYLPIHAPYHAPHLYNDSHVATLLSETVSGAWEDYTMNAAVLSSASGSFTGAANFQAMLRAAIEDILLHPVDWKKTVEGLSDLLESCGSTDMEIIQLATGAGNTLIHSLATISPQTSVRISAKNTSKDGKYSTGRRDQSKIAVIGMSGRFPGASSTESLWEILSKGQDTCKEVPALRWDVNTHVDPTGTQKNTSKVRFGCWLDEVDKFDARFFNMSPREAPQVDPAQRLALLTSYEAIERAGVVPGATPSTREDRVGVFFGTTSNDWCEANSGQDIDTYFIPGANRAFIPGRINYFFKFSGPSYSIDTACSSSLSAIHVACNSLWRGDIDMAIAGGTNVLTNPDMTAGLDRGHFLSTTGNCKTFDDSADGYCRGEGVATIVLKRLEDAIADRDPIEGIILGAYTNHSAEAESITRPHVGAQKAIFERILNDTSTHPYEVGYIEMHGTGTQAGDSREMSSVLDTFAPFPSAKVRSLEQSLYLGSIKANIGHGESVSGVTALIKVLMMMQKNTIPAHCGIKTKINHTFPRDMADRNVHIAMTQKQWKPLPKLARKAFVNNFSAAGGNSSVLLEEAPCREIVRQSDPRPVHLIAVSAKCVESLEGNIRSLESYLSGPLPENVSLPKLSYTTTARRIHHPYRIMISGSNIEDIQKSLSELTVEKLSLTKAIKPVTAIFTFTGQGSQYPGMAKQLFETSSQFRADLCQFDSLSQSLGFQSILPIFTASGGSDVNAYLPIVVQMANTCMQICLARLWKSWGIFPQAVIGHSLGEYAALNVAGVISDVDTLYLVGKRAQMLQQKCQRGTHSMLAVLASRRVIEQVLSNIDFEIACINAPEETVLSGPIKVMANAHNLLRAQNIKTTQLKVPYAFHSSQVQPILRAFERSAEGVKFRKPEIPVICPLLGRTVNEVGVFGPKYVARHCREPVNMLEALLSAKKSGVIGDGSFAIEFGPHPVVSGMVKSTLGSQVNVLSTLRRNKDPWAVIAESLNTLYAAGAKINWAAYHSDFSASQEVLDLPTYSWNLKSYWIPYKNDFMLYKGDHVPGPLKKTKPEVIEPPEIPVLNTTTIHSIVEQRTLGERTTLVVESDVCRPDMKPLVQGHKVEGIGLCTPSVYADMAFTMGEYLLSLVKPEFPEKLVDITDMIIEKALIAQDKGPQYLRATVEMNWSTKIGSCRFYSVDGDVHRKETVQHSSCQIRYTNNSLISTLQGDIHNVKKRHQSMRERCATGQTYRFNGPMAYNMVQALADFHPDYRCIDETIMDNETLEAACTVSFGGIKKGGNFHTHPGFLDGLTQSGGFVMNANNNTDLSSEVFVNHGWDSFQIFHKIMDDRQYNTYVCMKPAENKQWKGDIVVSSGDMVVASIRGVCLQGVPRRILRYILTSTAKPQTQHNDKPTTKIGTIPPTQRTQVQPLQNAVQFQQGLADLPQPKAHSSPVAPAKTSGLAEKALEIVSSQSGVDLCDLRDDTAFADVGIDSLLALTITSAFCEELDLDLDSSFFSDNLTVGDLRTYFGQTNQVLSSPAEDTEVALLSASSQNFTERTLQFDVAHQTTSPHKSALRTPSEDEMPNALRSALSMTLEENGLSMSSLTDDTSFADECLPIQISQEPEAEITVVSRCDSPNNSQEAVLRIIAEESGIALADLSDDVCFADIGIDSLLSLIIGSRIREELSIDIDAESILMTCPSVRELKSALGNNTDNDPGLASQASSYSASTNSRYVFEGQEPEEISRFNTPGTEYSDMYMSFKKPTMSTVPKTTSVVLQGLPKTASRLLFMFPDGSGSASSYSKIPRIASDLAIIGLNSPFLKSTQDWTCGMDELAQSYITEIRQRQPFGPYHFGGWSAGGIVAYRAAQLLADSGEDVRSLILLDVPNPTGLGQLPEHFYDYCENIGLFGTSGDGGKAPAWLIPHFRGMNKVLNSYYAAPFSIRKSPKVGIMWATKSVTARDGVPGLMVLPDDTPDMKFLTESRTDFTAGPWRQLLPNTTITIERAEDSDHFSMLQGEKAGKVASFVARILS